MLQVEAEDTAGEGRDNMVQGRKRSRTEGTEEQGPGHASACGEDDIKFIIQLVLFDSERTCCL